MSLFASMNHLVFSILGRLVIVLTFQEHSFHVVLNIMFAFHHVPLCLNESSGVQYIGQDYVCTYHLRFHQDLGADLVHIDWYANNNPIVSYWHGQTYEALEIPTLLCHHSWWAHVWSACGIIWWIFPLWIIWVDMPIYALRGALLYSKLPLLITFFIKKYLLCMCLVFLHMGRVPLSSRCMVVMLSLNIIFAFHHVLLCGKEIFGIQCVG